jgi:hypothetical protein
MAAAAAALKTEDTSLDIWRKVPPEEKLELMARAQSRGLAATIVLLVITGTMAVGLRMPWIFWAAFATIPFVFQFASAKAWRDIKPRTVLEYLAARSAARRYAYGAQSKDLTIDLMFKGILAADLSHLGENAELEAHLDSRDRVPVWVSLFPDTIVMMSERAGGAQLEFVHSTLDRLEVTAESFDDANGEGRRLSFQIEARKGETQRWFLMSPYPAALLVCERKIKRAVEEHQVQLERERNAVKSLFRSGDDESLSENSFSF